MSAVFLDNNGEDEEDISSYTLLILVLKKE